MIVQERRENARSKNNMVRANPLVLARRPNKELPNGDEGVSV